MLENKWNKDYTTEPRYVKGAQPYALNFPLNKPARHPKNAKGK